MGMLACATLSVLLPVRSSRLLVIVSFGPLHTLCSAFPGMAPGGFHLTSCLALFAASIVLWIGNRQREIQFRLTWLRQELLQSRVTHLELLASEIDFAHPVTAIVVS